MDEADVNIDVDVDRKTNAPSADFGDGHLLRAMLLRFSRKKS